MQSNDISIVIHLFDGSVKTFKKCDLILNARKQESEGVKPHYMHYLDDVPGWLVISTYDDGCYVVVKKYNQYFLQHGWQSDFRMV